MQTYFLTYGDQAYVNARNFSAWTAKYIAGFDNVIVAGPDDLDEDFKKKNASILSYKRGAGLWLWKPYIVLKTLDVMEEGDVLFYSDAGACFVRSVKRIIEGMSQDIWCCDIPTIEEQFTKSICFEALCCDSDIYKKSNQRIATFFAVRKSLSSKSFVTNWLTECEKEFLISPEQGKEAGTVLLSHREDQSIFSLLTKKMGYKSHKIPTTSYYYPELERWHGCDIQPMRHDEDAYNICIYLHKQRAIGLGKYILHFLYIRLPKFIMDFIARKRGIVC